MVKGSSDLSANERWLQEPQAAADLARALDWSTTNSANDTNVDSILEKLTNG